MMYVAISSSETDIEIGLSVLRNLQKHHYIMSHVAIVKTSSERDTQRDRVSRSVTVGRTVGRTAGPKLANYIVMGNLRLQHVKRTSKSDSAC